MRTKTVKKGELLQSQGDLTTYAYEVHSGLLRSYTIDDGGKEHIFMFAPEGWIEGRKGGHARYRLYLEGDAQIE